MNDGYSTTMPRPVPSTSSGYGGRGGMLDGHGGMPDVRGGMPDIRGGIPERHGGMPDVRGGMSDVRGHGGMPDPPQISSARSIDWGHGMPDGRGDMPDVRGGMPDVRGGMPDGRGGMPDPPQIGSARSFDTIIISNLPLDCDWQVRIMMFPWVFLPGNSWEIFSYSRESEASSRIYQIELLLKVNELYFSYFFASI